MFRVRAPAKVNLTLEVLRRRPDGYHEVTTVLQAVGLWDELELADAPALTLACDVPALAGPDNLALRAAELLRSVTQTARGAAMRLIKRIPVAGGLGGGSADAAAALVGLDRLWGLDLPRARLREMAASLGSDVPFFLVGGTALATGRGEQIAPLPPLPTTWIVLAAPPITLPQKTAALYGSLTRTDFADGGATKQAAALLIQRAALYPDLMVNTFERVAYRVFPDLARFVEIMRQAGSSRVHLAGSGPSLFSIASGQAAGEAVAERLRASGLDAWCVSTISGGLEVREQ